MNNINFFNNTKNKMCELEKLNQLIGYATEKENVDGVEFSIIFVNNNEIQRLNREYRQIDKETDVLSFAIDGEENDLFDYRMIGDIYISLDKAKEQAVEYGHSCLREVAFLMIHGFLHLLGYDHMNIEDEEKMVSRQEEILNEFGIKR